LQTKYTVERKLFDVNNSKSAQQIKYKTKLYKPDYKTKEILLQQITTVNSDYTNSIDHDTAMVNIVVKLAKKKTAYFTIRQDNQ
jgi:hypothetical protein